MTDLDYPYATVPDISPYTLVKNWLVTFNKPVDQSVEDNWELRSLAETCITEEAEEATDELTAIFRGGMVNKEALTKELCDLLWVTYQAGAFFGLPLDKAFERVYNSNMSKLGDDGKPLLREDGKILKGPNYKPADLGDLFD